MRGTPLRFAGPRRGFGFVEMGHSEHADQAIQELTGHSMDGRQLNVNEARERTGGGGGYGSPDKRPAASREEDRVQGLSG